jgi:hypothetical protein
MPTYEVERGDTVWALTRRALTAQLGRAPTNREILEVVQQVQVPSGDVNLIRPGEQVTIPVGPAYSPEVPYDESGRPVPPRPEVPYDESGRPVPSRPGATSPAPGSPAPAPAPGSPPAPTRVPGWESIEDEALQAMLDERPIAPSIYQSLFRPSTINPDDYRPMNYASPSDYGELFGQAVMDALPLAGLGGAVRGAGSYLARRFPFGRGGGTTRIIPSVPVRPAVPRLGAGTPPAPVGLPGPRPALGAGTPPPPGGWPGPRPGLPGPRPGPRPGPQNRDPYDYSFDDEDLGYFLGISPF